MKIFIIFREGDRERFAGFYQGFLNLDPASLIDRYNRNQNLGIVGVHAQGLMLLALHHRFLQVFGKSPIEWTNNNLLGLTQAIQSTGDSWEFVKFVNQ